MAQYIDKSALVAEIKRRIKEHHSGYLVCFMEETTELLAKQREIRHRDRIYFC